MSSDTEKNQTHKSPSWGVALIPFVVLSVILFIVIHIFGADALDGGSQMSLIFASAVVVAISMAFYKVPWQDLKTELWRMSRL